MDYCWKQIKLKVSIKYITKSMENESSTLSDSNLVTYDGNPMFYCLIDVPNNFKRVLEMTNKGFDVVFSTDMCPENSISQWRDHEGAHQQS